MYYFIFVHNKNGVEYASNDGDFEARSIEDDCVFISIHTLYKLKVGVKKLDNINQSFDPLQILLLLTAPILTYLILRNSNMQDVRTAYCMQMY